jgi:hypothetical protein
LRHARPGQHRADTSVHPEIEETHASIGRMIEPLSGPGCARNANARLAAGRARADRVNDLAQSAAMNLLAYYSAVPA